MQMDMDARDELSRITTALEALARLMSIADVREEDYILGIFMIIDFINERLVNMEKAQKKRFYDGLGQ
ncbi:MAG: hypothetical protein LBF71_05140 [Campylobacteraceae bacterium]|nr:hypothetical protein [Campylobacteraceae bacterium]